MNAEAHPEPTDARFSRLGSYLLLHPDGTGRVHVVLPERPDLPELCVLKRLVDQNRDPEQEARFERETTLALGLLHGAIARTFVVERIEGEVCVLQELVQGVSLAHLLKTLGFKAEPLSVDVAVYLARQLAGALAFVHSLPDAAVLHREVTPDNIMLSYGGDVKIIDFGIPKPAGDPSLARFGLIAGRRSHAAPEVVAGGLADARSDLYGLGVTLWQMLSGQAPEEVSDRGSVSFDAPSSFNEDVSPALDAIVSGLLAEAPEHRVQNAADVQAELGSLLHPGFRGAPAIAKLLGRTFDVEHERGVLAAEVARVRARLAKPPLSSISHRRKRRHPVMIVAGIAVIVVGAALTLLWMR